MKALSFTQPWATLVALRAKRIETRSWPTTHRGPLAIHASAGMPRAAREFAAADPAGRVLNEAGIRLGADCKELPRGAVVATARLVDVVPIVACFAGEPDWNLPDGSRWTPCAKVAMLNEGEARVWEALAPGLGWGSGGPGTGEEVRAAARLEAAFGDYTPGRWAWLLDDVVPLMVPEPARGSLGLWNWQPKGTNGSS